MHHALAVALSGSVRKDGGQLADKVHRSDKAALQAAEDLCACIVAVGSPFRLPDFNANILQEGELLALILRPLVDALCREQDGQSAEAKEAQLKAEAEAEAKAIIEAEVKAKEGSEMEVKSEQESVPEESTNVNEVKVVKEEKLEAVKKDIPPVNEEIVPAAAHRGFK